MYRTWIIAFLLIWGTLGWGYYPSMPEPRSDEEALFVRRILDFWRDKEYTFAKRQIETYLAENKKSPFADHFWAMLGDIALQESAFEEALACYGHVKSEGFKDHVQLKKWEALYHMGHYAQLYQEIAPLMKDSGVAPREEMVFYFAEGSFREGLTLIGFPESKQEGLALIQAALPYYTQLTSSQLFGSHAKLAMAEIYKTLGSPERAAAIYLELSENETQVDILFHAAAMLTECNKPKAIAIYSKLARSGGPRAEEAAYQWLLLLAEGENWEAISKERKLFTAILGKEKEAVGSFYLGMIAYDKKQYEQAVVDLKKCIGGNLPQQHEKRAILTLLACGCALERWELCEMALETLSAHFPAARPDGCLMLAAAYHRVGDRVRAFKLFDQVAVECHHSPYAEKATVEKIRLFMEEARHGEAHKLLLTCLEQFPDSERTIELVRLAIDLSLAQLAHEDVYGQLAVDLERGLQGNYFYKEEKRDREILLAQTYLKLNQVGRALQVLQGQEDPDPFLLTHCYIKEGTSPDKVISYGEEALKRYPHEKPLHLHLFNAYLELAKGQEEADYTRHAAHHLSVAIASYPIAVSNWLWLIHYYAKEEPTKAIPLLEALLENEDHFQQFDEEACLLARLYQENNQLDHAAWVLERVVGLQHKSSQSAKLKLAEIYLAQRREGEARDLYHKLEESPHLETAFAARLQLARLDFHSEPDASLKKLHDLAERKSLVNEPIHLEAALEYAELKATLYPPQERSHHLLDLLNAMKVNFTKQDDIWSKDYHASRECYPEKDLVYQAYMRYLDARIFMLEAQLSPDAAEGKTKMNAAKALLSTLTQEKYSVSPYLREKVAAGTDTHYE